MCQNAETEVALKRLLPGANGSNDIEILWLSLFRDTSLLSSDSVKDWLVKHSNFANTDSDDVEHFIEGMG